jgi:hypothetical protein
MVLPSRISEIVLLSMLTLLLVILVVHCNLFLLRSSGAASRVTEGRVGGQDMAVAV